MQSIEGKTRRQIIKTAKILSWVVVLLGVWEVLAPFILGYFTDSAALWNAIAVGLTLIVLATLAALSRAEMTLKALERGGAALGVWLIVAPSIVHYSDIAAAKWNDIIVGAGVTMLTVWAVLTLSVGSSVHI